MSSSALPTPLLKNPLMTTTTTTSPIHASELFMPHFQPEAPTGMTPSFASETFFMPHPQPEAPTKTTTTISIHASETVLPLPEPPKSIVSKKHDFQPLEKKKMLKRKSASPSSSSITPSSSVIYLIQVPLCVDIQEENGCTTETYSVMQVGRTIHPERRTSQHASSWRQFLGLPLKRKTRVCKQEKKEQQEQQEQQLQPVRVLGFLSHATPIGCDEEDYIRQIVGSKLPETFAKSLLEERFFSNLDGLPASDEKRKFYRRHHFSVSELRLVSKTEANHLQKFFTMPPLPFSYSNLHSMSEFQTHCLLLPNTTRVQIGGGSGNKVCVLRSRSPFSGMEFKQDDDTNSIPSKESTFQTSSLTIDRPLVLSVPINSQQQKKSQVGIVRAAILVFACAGWIFDFHQTRKKRGMMK